MSRLCRVAVKYKVIEVTAIQKRSVSNECNNI